MTKIHDFWAWFATAAHRFEADEPEADAIAELDSRVAELGELVWELGPGIEAKYALVLSPDGDAELLPLSRALIAEAPALADWEFHPARPPKQWKLRFSIEGEHGQTTHVDARSWRYVLLKYPDGTYDVIIEQPNAVGMDEDQQWLACILLLDGLLGEATRLTFIGDVTPVLRLSPEHAEKATPIEGMPAHLESLLQPSAHS